MKRFAYTLGLVAATILTAAPLAAQSGNGPWWDPGRTQTRTQPRTGQNGSVYGRDGNVYGQNTQADGQWRAYSRDRNGNTIYMRTRYDSNGNLVREYATRNIIGRYNVIDRQVLSNNNGQYGNRGNRGTYDRVNTNDRWDQNNGHDNGKHNGQYKNKNKNKNKDRDRDRDRYDR
jgi:hypothetical protein